MSKMGAPLSLPGTASFPLAAHTATCTAQTSIMCGRALEEEAWC